MYIGLFLILFMYLVVAIASITVALYMTGHDHEGEWNPRHDADALLVIVMSGMWWLPVLLLGLMWVIFYKLPLRLAELISSEMGGP